MSTRKRNSLAWLQIIKVTTHTFKEFLKSKQKVLIFWVYNFSEANLKLEKFDYFLFVYDDFIQGFFQIFIMLSDFEIFIVTVMLLSSLDL